MSHMPRTPLAAAALALLGACGLETPSDPTWIDDVRPILHANCVRCHGYPAISEAPVTFRLDAYDITLLPEDEDREDLDGAALAANSGWLEDVFSGEAASMPPRFPLEDRQVDIILAWAAQGNAEEGILPPRGERDDNATPDMTLVDDLAVGSSSATGDYLIEDGDGDPVTGVLFAQAGGGDPIPLQSSLYAGTGEVSFRLSLLDPGTYDLFAELDDGVEVTTVDLGSLEVP